MKAASAEDVKLVYTADIGTGSESDYEMAMVAAEPAAAAEPAITAHFEGEAFGGMVKLFANMYDDGTVVICANKGDGDIVLTKGTYEGAGLPVFTLEKGTAELKATSAEDVKLVYTADIGTGSESDYEMAMVVAEPAAAAEPATTAHFEGEAFGGMVKLFANMYDDGTVAIYANKGDGDIELTKGTYEGAGLPVFTLEKGTAELKATSAEDVKLIYTADIGTGSESAYEMAKVN